MKAYICEKCAALYSPETADELNHFCINTDNGILIEVDVDEGKVGALVDKEVKKLRARKEVVT